MYIVSAYIVAEGCSLVQTFGESCVHFDFNHSSVHMKQIFVIQGFPTLMWTKMIKSEVVAIHLYVNMLKVYL